jgi:hypothetical protein
LLDRVVLRIATVIIGSGVPAEVSALVAAHRNGRFHNYAWLFPVHGRSISVARIPDVLHIHSGTLYVVLSTMASRTGNGA